MVLFATGYRNEVPSFLDGIRNRIQWQECHFLVNRHYSIDIHNRVFVQNAELQSHGFNTADLSLGPYRNAVILNQILGRDLFPVEKGVTFQQFGVPKSRTSGSH